MSQEQIPPPTPEDVAHTFVPPSQVEEFDAISAEAEAAGRTAESLSRKSGQHWEDARTDVLRAVGLTPPGVVANNGPVLGLGIPGGQLFNSAASAGANVIEAYKNKSAANDLATYRNMLREETRDIVSPELVAGGAIIVNGKLTATDEQIELARRQMAADISTHASEYRSATETKESPEAIDDGKRRSLRNALAMGLGMVVGTPATAGWLGGAVLKGAVGRAVLNSAERRLTNEENKAKREELERADAALERECNAKFKDYMKQNPGRSDKDFLKTPVGIDCYGRWAEAQRALLNFKK